MTTDKAYSLCEEKVVMHLPREKGRGISPSRLGLRAVHALLKDLGRYVDVTVSDDGASTTVTARITVAVKRGQMGAWPEGTQLHHRVCLQGIDHGN